MEEYDRTPTFEELADMFIVACGLCRFDMVVAMSYMTIVATALNERKEIYASAVFPNKVDEKMAKTANALGKRHNTEIIITQTRRTK